MVEWALPEINLLLCTRCGSCVELCPTGAAVMGPEGPFVAHPAECTYCAECEAICPHSAITCTFEIVWGPDE
jgi:formate hydrogenlyase subunit 6/NADH:ubiquinone oxidoreductase subunit I